MRLLAKLILKTKEKYTKLVIALQVIVGTPNLQLPPKAKIKLRNLLRVDV